LYTIWFDVTRNLFRLLHCEEFTESPPDARGRVYLKARWLKHTEYRKRKQTIQMFQMV